MREGPTVHHHPQGLTNRPRGTLRSRAREIHSSWPINPGPSLNRSPSLMTTCSSELGCFLTISSMRNKSVKQRAEMDGSVQIVDQLRTDGGLRQNQFDGGQRIASVAIEHRKERRVFAGGLQGLPFDCHRASFGQSGQGRDGAIAETRGAAAQICCPGHWIVPAPHRPALTRNTLRWRYNDSRSHRASVSPGFYAVWMVSMAKQACRPPSARDRAPADNTRGSSCRRSSTL